VLAVVAIGHLDMGRTGLILSKPHISVGADVGNHSHSPDLHLNEVAHIKAVTPRFIFIVHLSLHLNILPYFGGESSFYLIPRKVKNLGKMEEDFFGAYWILVTSWLHEK
jgi:hypothetical protein